MTNRVRLWVVVFLLALLAPVLPQVQASPPSPATKPGRVWVQFKKGNRKSLPQKASALAQSEVAVLVPELEGAVLKVPVGQERELSRRLAENPDVAYALPIPLVHAQRIPNDPGFSQQWNLVKIGAPAAWDVVTASRVIIAIVDSGVDLTHPDLAGQIWTNQDEIPGNGIDDDHNGQIDDIHGWHFYSNGAAGDNNVQDDNGHGTHVSGIAAAATNNGLGVAGVSWGATIMPVKVLDSNGEGYWDDIIRGMLYAVANGARVINLSLGDSQPFPPLEDAVAYARQHGVLVVAAAGNHVAAGDPTEVLYPAVYPEVMAVGATDGLDQRSDFSNTGPALSVAAPGTGVYSTYRGGTYGTMSGTSMAAPHVAGLAALIWTLHPGYSVTQVQRTIELTARDVNAATLPGRDSELGWGRIDAGRAVSQRIYWYQLPLVARNPASGPIAMSP